MLERYGGTTSVSPTAYGNLGEYLSSDLAGELSDHVLVILTAHEQLWYAPLFTVTALASEGKIEQAVACVRNGNAFY